MASYIRYLLKPDLFISRVFSRVSRVSSLKNSRVFSRVFQIAEKFQSFFQSFFIHSIYLEISTKNISRENMYHFFACGGLNQSVNTLCNRFWLLILSVFTIEYKYARRRREKFQSFFQSFFQSLFQSFNSGTRNTKKKGLFWNILI